MMRVGIVTVSDRVSRGEAEDQSGPAIADIVTDRLNGTVIKHQVIPDIGAEIESTLQQWSDMDRLDLIFTTGGTGFSPRDVTPEATLAVVDRLAPGFGEAMRAASLKVTPHAMLSRAAAGIRGRTLIINLPGSPKAVRENLEVILPALPHAVELLRQGSEPIDYQFARPGEHQHAD